MATVTVRAKVAGIYGDNQQYRESGTVFMADADHIPEWAESVVMPILEDPEPPAPVEP